MSRTSHFLMACLFVALPATASFAHPRGHDRDAYRRPEYRWEHRDRDRDSRRAREYRHERHEQYMQVAQKDHGRPPGWDKGKKKGWGDCDVPPGQAKKQGCEGYSYNRDHDRDHRRPRDVRSTRVRRDGRRDVRHDVRQDDRRSPRRDARVTPRTTTSYPRPGSTAQPAPQRTTTTAQPASQRPTDVGNFRKNPR
jgi:hypothetical protein